MRNREKVEESLCEKTERKSRKKYRRIKSESKDNDKEQRDKH